MAKLSDKNKSLTFIPAPQSPDSAGFITESADDVVPTGWLECNGQAVSRTEYAELFALIGTTYGVGDGSTTFNLPGGSQLNNAQVTGTLDVTGASTLGGDLTVDTDTLHVDSTNNRVGIGTISPSSPLHLKSSGPGLTFRVENSLGNIIGGHAETAANDGIYTLRDSTGSIQIQLSADTTQHSYFTGGNVGIGTTNPTDRLVVDGGIRGQFFSSQLSVVNGDPIAPAIGRGGYMVLVASNYGAGNLVRSGMYHVILNNEGTAVAFQTEVNDLNGQTATFSVSGGSLRVSGLSSGNTRLTVIRA